MEEIINCKKSNKKLEQIAKGLEYKIYLSIDGKYVIKVPRIYTRVLGIVDSFNIESNIEKCKKYIEVNKLPILIPSTWVERYRNSIIIIQEYVEGRPNKELTKKMMRSIRPLPIEDNFIDLRIDNILYHKDKAYLIDTSGGFYYNLTQKYGKKASKLLWHLFQMFKLCFRQSENILYQRNKVYINIDFANFLENMNKGRKFGKRIKIFSWHLVHIVKCFFNMVVNFRVQKSIISEGRLFNANR